MRDKDGTFEGFIEHMQILMPAIKALEARGLETDYIAKLLEFAAGWLRSRDGKKE